MAEIPAAARDVAQLIWRMFVGQQAAQQQAGRRMATAASLTAFQKSALRESSRRPARQGPRAWRRLALRLRPLEKIGRNSTRDISMVAVYVGTCPYDRKLELENFKHQQAVFEAAWRLTSDPQVLRDALLHAQAAGQHLRAHLTPDWLVEASGNTLMRGRTGKRRRTGQTSKRLRERMHDVRTLSLRPDLLRKGHTMDDALDLAATVLKGRGNARDTIKDVYDKVKRDLDRKKHESEYFLLVARADPTVIPVHRVQRPDGVIVINGVPQAVRG